ncbi:MAG: histidine phosphatase family protein, partial [Dehalococcoidia bacterium]|nr:histidine phosphatase family protein [Dehalococcoidia bacterium]
VVRERYPDFLRRWLSDDLAGVPMPGGETLRQVQQRAWSAVETLRERHADATVAAVTHNFVILSLLCRALDLPLARFRRLRHDLAAVSVLELTAERQVLVALNDRSHLRAEDLAGEPSWGRS